MPINDNVKLHFRGILLSLLGIIAAAVGIVAVGFFSDHFNNHPLNATISLSPSLGIDIFGALLPVVLAIGAAVLFINWARFPIKKLAVTLAASMALAFVLCNLTDEGLAGPSLLFSLIASAVATAVNVIPKPFTELKENFVSSLLLAFVCVPLSLFAVDLFYASHFASSIIGGNGLSDGVLLSTIYAPLSTAAMFSVLAYLSQTFQLVGQYRNLSIKSQ